MMLLTNTRVLLFSDVTTSIELQNCNAIYVHLLHWDVDDKCGLYVATCLSIHTCFIFQTHPLLGCKLPTYPTPHRVQITPETLIYGRCVSFENDWPPATCYY